ncbi:MAG: hypothetical protein L0H31_03095 [Nocardioidaceae bacterium]|nr:hypothetical protein [Nocardioidaceae bacterium]
MAASARASIDPRRAELAALHAEITRASMWPGRAAVVIDQAVDLRRELQSDHAEAHTILHALHPVAGRGELDASALTAATSSAATLVSATNAAAYSLGPISRCLTDELEISAARAMTTISERFIETALLTSIQLDYHLVAAVQERGRGRARATSRPRRAQCL